MLFQAYDHFFPFYPFKHNKRYEIRLRAKFRAKPTKFEPLYAKNCKKRLKKPQKRNLARNFKNMSIIIDSLLFHTIIYTKYCCVPSFVC